MKMLGKSILFVSSLLAATSLFAQNNENKHEGANKSICIKAWQCRMRTWENAFKNDGNEKGSPCH